MKREIAVSLLGAIATAIGFAVDIVWGWRVLGAFMVLASVWTFFSRRAAYSVPGYRSGHLTGAPAIVSALINLAIGVAIFSYSAELTAWVRRVVQAS